MRVVVVWTRVFLSVCEREWKRRERNDTTEKKDDNNKSFADAVAIIFSVVWGAYLYIN